MPLTHVCVEKNVIESCSLGEIVVSGVFCGKHTSSHVSEEKCLLRPVHVVAAALFSCCELPESVPQSKYTMRHFCDGLRATVAVMMSSMVDL